MNTDRSASRPRAARRSTAQAPQPVRWQGEIAGMIQGAGHGGHGQVARVGVVDRGDPLDHDRAVTAQLAAETLRELAEEHAHPATAPGAGLPEGLGLAGPPELTAPFS